MIVYLCANVRRMSVDVSNNSNNSNIYIYEIYMESISVHTYINVRDIHVYYIYITTWLITL